MDEHSRKVIREDGNSGEDGIPDQVTIDQMNYIGMIRQCIDYTGPDHDEKDMIQLEDYVEPRFLDLVKESEAYRGIIRSRWSIRCC